MPTCSLELSPPPPKPRARSARRCAKHRGISPSPRTTPPTDTAAPIPCPPRAPASEGPTPRRGQARVRTLHTTGDVHRADTSRRPAPSPTTRPPLAPPSPRTPRPPPPATKKHSAGYHAAHVFAAKRATATDAWRPLLPDIDLAVKRVATHRERAEAKMRGGSPELSPSPAGRSPGRQEAPPPLDESALRSVRSAASTRGATPGSRPGTGAGSPRPGSRGGPKGGPKGGAPLLCLPELIHRPEDLAVAVAAIRHRTTAFEVDVGDTTTARWVGLAPLALQDVVTAMCRNAACVADVHGSLAPEYIARLDGALATVRERHQTEWQRRERREREQAVRRIEGELRDEETARRHQAHAIALALVGLEREETRRRRATAHTEDDAILAIARQHRSEGRYAERVAVWRAGERSKAVAVFDVEEAGARTKALHAQMRAWRELIVSFRAATGKAVERQRQRRRAEEERNAALRQEQYDTRRALLRDEADSVRAVEAYYAAHLADDVAALHRRHHEALEAERQRREAEFRRKATAATFATDRARVAGDETHERRVLEAGHHRALEALTKLLQDDAGAARHKQHQRLAAEARRAEFEREDREVPKVALRWDGDPLRLPMGPLARPVALCTNPQLGVRLHTRQLPAAVKADKTTIRGGTLTVTERAPSATARVRALLPTAAPGPSTGSAAAEDGWLKAWSPDGVRVIYDGEPIATVHPTDDAAAENPVLWECTVAAGAPVPGLKSLLAALHVDNPPGLGYDPHTTAESSLTLELRAALQFRVRSGVVELSAPQVKTAPRAVLRMHPMLAAPAADATPFLEGSDPEPLFTQWVMHAPSGFRWDDFSRAGNRAARDAGLAVAPMKLTLVCEEAEPGDALVLDTRDGALSLSKEGEEPGAGGTPVWCQYIIYNVHSVARISGRRINPWPHSHVDAVLYTRNVTSSSLRSPLVIQVQDTLAATHAFLHKLISSLCFWNTTVDPVEGVRTMRLDATGPDGRVASLQRQLRVVPVDDLPVVDLGAETALFRYPLDPGDATLRGYLPRPEPGYLCPQATVEDPDSRVYYGGWLEVEVGGGGPGDWVYLVPNPAEPLLEDMTITDGRVVCGGQHVATVDRGHATGAMPVAPPPPTSRRARSRGRISGSTASARVSNVETAAPAPHDQRLLRIDFASMPLPVLQALYRSVAFVSFGEHLVGPRRVEFRLVGGDPHVEKFRKFDPFEPVLHALALSVCQPLITAPQFQLHYREGMGALPIPQLAVTHDPHAPRSVWTGGSVSLRIVSGFSADEDRVLMRHEYSQAEACTATEIHDTDPRVPAATRSNRLATRTYDVANHQRGVFGRMAAAPSEIRVSLHEMEFRGRRAATASKSPARRTHSGRPGDSGRRDGEGEDPGQVRRRDVQTLLRQLAFENRSSNPSELVKVLALSVSDGLCTTHAVFELTIQLVDDVTEVVRMNLGTVECRNGRPGLTVPVFEDCILEDPDSDEFNTGYVAVAARHCHPGDALRFLTLAEQRKRRSVVAAPSQNASPTSKLAVTAIARDGTASHSERFQRMRRQLKPVPPDTPHFEFALHPATGELFLVTGPQDRPFAASKAEFAADVPGLSVTAFGESLALGTPPDAVGLDAAPPSLPGDVEVGEGREVHFIGHVLLNVARGRPKSRGKEKDKEPLVNVAVEFAPRSHVVPQVTLAMASAVLRCIAFTTTADPWTAPSGTRQLLVRVNPGGCEDGRLRVNLLVMSAYVGFNFGSAVAPFKRRTGPIQPLQRISVQDGSPRVGFLCVELTQGFVPGEDLLTFPDIGPARPFVLKNSGRTLWTSKDVFVGNIGFFDDARGFVLGFDSQTRATAPVLLSLLKGIRYTNTREAQTEASRGLRVTLCDGTEFQDSVVDVTVPLQADDDTIDIACGRLPAAANALPVVAPASLRPFAAAAAAAQPDAGRQVSPGALLELTAPAGWALSAGDGPLPMDAAVDVKPQQPRSTARWTCRVRQATWQQLAATLARTVAAAGPTAHSGQVCAVVSHPSQTSPLLQWTFAVGVSGGPAVVPGPATMPTSRQPSLLPHAKAGVACRSVTVHVVVPATVAAAHERPLVGLGFHPMSGCSVKGAQVLYSNEVAGSFETVGVAAPDFDTFQTKPAAPVVTAAMRIEFRGAVTAEAVERVLQALALPPSEAEGATVLLAADFGYGSVTRSAAPVPSQRRRHGSPPRPAIGLLSSPGGSPLRPPRM